MGLSENRITPNPLVNHIELAIWTLWFFNLLVEWKISTGNYRLSMIFPSNMFLFLQKFSLRPIPIQRGFAVFHPIPQGAQPKGPKGRGPVLGPKGRGQLELEHLVLSAADGA